MMHIDLFARLFEDVCSRLDAPAPALARDASRVSFPLEVDGTQWLLAQYPSIDERTAFLTSPCEASMSISDPTTCELLMEMNYALAFHGAPGMFSRDPDTGDFTLQVPLPLDECSAESVIAKAREMGKYTHFATT